MNSELEPLPPRKSKKSRKRKGKRWLIFIFTIILLMVAAVVAYGAYLNSVAEENIDKISIVENVELPPEQKADQKPLTILLLGLDSRDNFGFMNTDVIMMLTLNPEHKEGTIVSIPRDTYIQPTGYQGGHKANSFYSMAKLNGYGEGEFGEVKMIFGEFLDVPVDYAVMINFNAFVDVIDALGGIDVYVDQDMRYVDSADGTNIDLKEGQQHLDGEDALDFVRYRHSNLGTAESSDFERNERQQRVLSAVIDQAKSISTAFILDDLMNALGDNMQTDMPQSQIKELIKTYLGISSNSIEYIPITGSWRSPYTYLDEEQLELAKSKLKAQLDPTLVEQDSEEADTEA